MPFIDKLTKVDDLLRAQIEILERIAEPLESLILSYPQDGITTYLPSGELRINYLTGEVVKPDGTKDTLNDSLQAHSLTCACSLLITNTKSIIVRLNDRGTMPLLPGKLTPIYRQRFSRVTLYLPSPTDIFILSSIDPNGILTSPLETFKEGNPYITRGTLTQDVAEEIDIRAGILSASGRRENGHFGFVANVGPEVGDIQVKLSSDGDTFTDDYYTIVKDGVENLTNADIHTIQLTAVNANASYEINMR